MRREDWPAHARSKLANLPPDAVALIESHQPFIEGNGDETSWLAYLDQLCNVSKHRLIPLVAANLHSTTLGLKHLGVAPQALQLEKADQITDGVVLARVIPEPGPGAGGLAVSIQLHTYIAFAPGPPGYLQPVLDTMPALVAAVIHVRDQMAALFGLASF